MSIISLPRTERLSALRNDIPTQTDGESSGDLAVFLEQPLSFPDHMPGIPALTVAIVEDQLRIREGLQTLIDGTDGYRCQASFASMEEALPIIGREPPDIVLVDIGLPGMSGIEGMRLLKERFPNLPLVVLTVYEDDKRIFDAICAGACGYLLKKTPPSRLLESLREAVNGGAPMSPEVARKVIALFETTQSCGVP